jgi:3',5'-cyclic AMP phosphodiesterase CpdA
VWIRGTRACPDRYRLVTAGDIQTNPLQFERIIEDLHAQRDAAAAANEPLLGFFILGDLSESTEIEEFSRIREMLESSPIPVSVVPGNHDVFGDEASLYNRWFGPGNYADTVCRTRLVHLDNASGDLAHSVEGRLPELLERSGFDHLIPAMHIPPYEDGTSQGMRDQQQAAYMLSEFARNGVDRIMTGHVHYWRENTEVLVGDEVLHQIITGTAGGNQGSGHLRFGVTRLTFGGPGDVESCFHEVVPPGTVDVDHSDVSNPIDFCEGS